jgi:hypothetical protein
MLFHDILFEYLFIIKLVFLFDSYMLHGYGYVYRYRKDTETRIRQFSKEPDTRIRLLFKK